MTQWWCPLCGTDFRNEGHITSCPIPGAARRIEHACAGLFIGHDVVTATLAEEMLSRGLAGGFPRRAAMRALALAMQANGEKNPEKRTGLLLEAAAHVLDIQEGK